MPEVTIYYTDDTEPRTFEATNEEALKYENAALTDPTISVVDVKA
jgi:hypothetical protein